MITITDKHNCCGCSACVQACPKQCISFEEDEQGFRYPLVDKAICVDCGLCEKVCPVLNAGEPRHPLAVYAAINTNEEIRKESSSGGIFTALAEAVLDEGGVVFGARFNDQWEVVHAYTESKEGLAPFRGSKYVQSRVGETYRQAKAFLQQGRKVMYTGTPCQIAGLKRYLGKEYDQLLTVDVVCHGVPSPLVWRDYLRDITANNLSQIASINFRDKSTGWKNFSVRISGQEGKDYVNESFRQNLFMQLFLRNFCLRPSCHACAAKSGKSGSDITIADFWGMEDSNWNDNKGTSCIIAYKEYVSLLLSSFVLKTEVSNIEIFSKMNPAYNKTFKYPDNYKLFWSNYKDFDIQHLIKLYAKQSKKEIIRSLTIRLICKLGILSIVKKILRK